jgi:uncharacterized protein (DUF433 family)
VVTLRVEGMRAPHIRDAHFGISPHTPNPDLNFWTILVPQVMPRVGEPRRSADERAVASGLQAQAREMAELWTRANWTISELADAYNCTANQVYYRVRRYGAGAEGRVVAPRSCGRRPGRSPGAGRPMD